MQEYELMVILDPEIDERTVAPSLDKFLNVVRNDGGSIDKVDIWGRRRLAYEIDKKVEGIYAVVNFSAESKTTSELERQLGLSEAVMRTKVLRSETAVSQTSVSRRQAEAKAAKAASAPAAAAPTTDAKPGDAKAAAAPAEAEAETTTEAEAK